MIDRVEKGSITAKNGFSTEDDVVDRFNNWRNDCIAQDWLKVMGYGIDDIECVKAEKIKGSFKSDVQVQVHIEIMLKKY